jgi:hypothetical protein
MKRYLLALLLLVAVPAFAQQASPFDLLREADRCMPILRQADIIEHDRCRHLKNCGLGEEWVDFWLAIAVCRAALVQNRELARRYLAWKSTYMAPLP